MAKGKTITMIPAYGRDYQTAEEVREAWNARKDFKVQDVSSPWSGAAVNSEDLRTYEPGATARIRFKRMTEVVLIEN